MITVATYTNATESYNAKELLETNGISCQLQNDLLSKTQTIGKIELRVEAKDAKLARDVLANAMQENDDLR